jgi:hypothetical protein
MFSRIPEWLRSVIITFVVTFLGLALVPDFEWSSAALAAAALTAVRTALSGVLPGGSFGNKIIGSDEIGDE